MKKVYSPFLAYSKDRNFASIRFRLPTQKDKFVTRVYLKRESVDLKENLIKGSYITPIARFNNIWITNPFCEKNGNMIAVQMSNDSWKHIKIPDAFLGVVNLNP